MPNPSRMSKPFGIAFLVLGAFFLVQTVRMTGRESDGQPPHTPGIFSREEAPRTHRDFQTILYDASTWAFTRAELARVDDHVGEMSRVGFRPILPVEVSRFVSVGEPLPANAVLILFSGLDPAQLQQVHDIMARRKWPFAAAVSIKGVATGTMQEKMNQLAGPAWEMGLRLESSGGTAERDPWLSLDPRLYRSKFAHRARPAAPLEMAPVVPVVFGGMDAAFSNAYMAPGSLNCLAVRPGWIGRDLVGKLLSERSSVEAAAGRGGMAWFGRSGVAGCDASVLSLQAGAGGPAAEISPALPEEKGRQCAVFEFENDPAGVTLQFGAEKTVPSSSLKFEPGGRLVNTTYSSTAGEPAITPGVARVTSGKTRVEIFASSGDWWIIVNGAPFPEVPLPLAGGWGGGHFAVRLDAPAAGNALVRFHASLRRDLAEKFTPPALHAPLPDPAATQTVATPGQPGATAISPAAPVLKTPESLRVEAETALAEGPSLAALRALAEWWAAAPADVRPAELIAEVLIRLGHKSEALDFYRQALELDPARETLALRLSDLLQELGRAEEARTVLNAYVQIFPHSPPLLLAQADWLSNRSRMAEATERAARVIEIDPGNLRALLILLAGQPSPSDRRTNTDRLLALAATTGSERPFLEAVLQGGLLSIPGPEPLWAAVEEACGRMQDPKLTGRMNLLKPAPAAVPKGVDGDHLDPAWELRDADLAPAGPGLDLQVKAELKEFSLRMQPSAQWLDGFIETEAGGLTGGLWLVARKSVDHVVRFGFDRQEGRIFLQTWTGGGRTLLANQRFDLAPDFFTTNHVYRLECRGRGVQAFLDGTALARVPEALPSPWEGGSFGLVFRADEPGVARASLLRLSCASVLPRITLLSGGSSGEDGDLPADQARAIAAASSILSPLLFTTAPDGTLTSVPGPADDFIRLLARYHKLHYMPGITCTNAAPPAAEDLADLAGIHASDGFVLHLDTPPPAEWQAAARGVFLSRGTGLICVLRKPGDTSATLVANFGPGIERPPLNARVLEGLDAAPPPEPLEPVLYLVKEKT